MERFGLGYEDLKALNPKIVYCAIAGYDRAGPEAARPGYDLVIQGESGLMGINGEAGRPPLKFGVAAVDLFTGMYAAQAVLAALFKTRSTGKGCRIDLALYDCGVMISSYYGLEALLLGDDPPRYGNEHPSIVPYGVFQSADGPLVIAVGNNRQYQNFCIDVLGRPDLAHDARFETNLKRAQNREALSALLHAELLRHPRQALLDRLTAAGIPNGQVLGLHEALVGTRTQAAGLLNRLPHPRLARCRCCPRPGALTAIVFRSGVLRVWVSTRRKSPPHSKPARFRTCLRSPRSALCRATFGQGSKKAALVVAHLGQAAGMPAARASMAAFAALRAP
jgi:crotonobetainyl-CoA:carnitine CoA-transferase CaiB-like acyl-CoA transferase